MCPGVGVGELSVLHGFRFSIRLFAPQGGHRARVVSGYPSPFPLGFPSRARLDFVFVCCRLALLPPIWFKESNLALGVAPARRPSADLCDGLGL